jgi:hypothetical protein
MRCFSNKSVTSQIAETIDVTDSGSADKASRLKISSLAPGQSFSSRLYQLYPAANFN